MTATATPGRIVADLHVAGTPYEPAGVGCYDTAPYIPKLAVTRALAPLAPPDDGRWRFLPGIVAYIAQHPDHPGLRQIEAALDDPDPEWDRWSGRRHRGYRRRRAHGMTIVYDPEARKVLRVEADR